MSEFDRPLTNIKIASPCSADWNRMDGDERKRFCSDCKLNVYNLSGMTRYDAEHLLRMSEGRLCVRYFMRADGSIMTQDCPVGWAKVKQRVTVFGAVAFSLVLSFLGAIIILSTFNRRTVVMGDIGFRATPTPKVESMMGVMANVAVPTPTPTPRGIRGEPVVGLRAVPTPKLVQTRKSTSLNGGPRFSF